MPRLTFRDSSGCTKKVDNSCWWPSRYGERARPPEFGRRSRELDRTSGTARGRARACSASALLHSAKPPYFHSSRPASALDRTRIAELATRTQNVIARGERLRRAAAGESLGSLTRTIERGSRARAGAARPGCSAPGIEEVRVRSVRRSRVVAVPLNGATSESVAQTPRRAPDFRPASNPASRRWPCALRARTASGSAEPRPAGVAGGRSSLGITEPPAWKRRVRRRRALAAPLSGATSSSVAQTARRARGRDRARAQDRRGRRGGQAAHSANRRRGRSGAPFVVVAVHAEIRAQARRVPSPSAASVTPLARAWVARCPPGNRRSDSSAPAPQNTRPKRGVNAWSAPPPCP